ncbi:hypothetical protein [Bradyrhizobium sp. dw_411]|uniref:hypothetical protein n=1 Tax=Bradyrhizobium sp. dw_411 TaxID=2720082 RepID=UPI001BD06AE2|nr:hypothetical protein [Bradyrhizobium sp. dw_411]
MTGQFGVVFFRDFSCFDAKSSRVSLMISSLYEMNEATPEEGLDLLRAFMKLRNREVRTQIIELVERALSEQRAEKRFQRNPRKP